jgi:hypothetical protein
MVHCKMSESHQIMCYYYKGEGVNRIGTNESIVMRHEFPTSANTQTSKE